jgi:hypothetical protein
MWKRRLLFSLVFAIGTLVAVYGWLSEVRTKPKLRYAAMIGHLIQVVGAFGAMIVPDEQRETGDLHEEEGFRID